MKKTVSIFVCILFLAAFALAAYALNETESNATDSIITQPNATASNVSIQSQNRTTKAAPIVLPSVAKPKTAVDLNCNKNKIADAGENCFNCPSDVKCKSGEMCTETGVCRGTINYTTYIILGIGAFLFIGIIIFAKGLCSKSQRKSQSRFSSKSSSKALLRKSKYNCLLNKCLLKLLFNSPRRMFKSHNLLIRIFL